jgi:hypothetical protein
MTSIDRMIFVIVKNSTLYRTCDLRNLPIERIEQLYEEYRTLSPTRD